MQALPGPWGRSKQALPILAIAVAALQSPPTAATPTARSCLCLPFSKGPALQSAPQAAVPGTGRASGLSAALAVSEHWSLQDCLLSYTSGHVTCCSLRPLAATTSPRKSAETDHCGLLSPDATNGREPGLHPFPSRAPRGPWANTGLHPTPYSWPSYFQPCGG